MHDSRFPIDPNSADVFSAQKERLICSILGRAAGNLFSVNALTSASVWNIEIVGNLRFFHLQAIGIAHTPH